MTGFIFAVFVLDGLSNDGPVQIMAIYGPAKDVPSDIILLYIVKTILI